MMRLRRRQKEMTEAKEPSERATRLPKKEVDAWAQNLPIKEKNVILVRLIDGDDPYLAAEIRQRAIVHEREQAEERKKHLESLVGKESGLWAKVDELIATRQSKRCDEAVSLLQDLHDLADMKGKSSDFSLNMSELHREHTRKTTLVDRFRKAKLLG